MSLWHLLDVGISFRVMETRPKARKSQENVRQGASALDSREKWKTAARKPFSLLSESGNRIEKFCFYKELK